VQDAWRGEHARHVDPVPIHSRMMDHLSPYTRLGAALVIGGAIFALAALFIIQSIPLIALGISVVLVGVVSLVLAQSLPAVPPAASAVLLRTGLENLSALIEETGLTSQALYLPSRLAGGSPMALIPLHANPFRPRIEKALPAKLIVSYGSGPHDVGLLVRTAGTTVMQLLENHLGASSAELESAMAAILVGRLDLADGVRVQRDRERVIVEVSAPRLGQQDIWMCRSLGSPLASIITTVVAEGMDRTVAIRSEHWEDRRAVIVVELIDDPV
jgi:hypothetical protein